jgi:elongation factor G
LPSISFPHPVFSAAITPKTKADLDKLGTALARLTEEDPTFRVEREATTAETVLSGMGESHIDIAARRLQSKFGVEIVTTVPKVPYKETIGKVGTSQYRHKKQTGGAGQFAEVWLRVEPLPRGTGFEYDSEVREGHISRSFIPSIEKGIRQVLPQGVIAGYPVVDVKSVVYDGKEHPVDSKDIAFQIAGREAFKEAVRDAAPVLLEPIMTFAITMPDASMGDVLGDLNTKRARVLGTEQKGERSIITVQAPLAEMQGYATDMRSITQGRGMFSMEFSHYEEVPKHQADEIIARARVKEGAE